MRKYGVCSLLCLVMVMSGCASEKVKSEEAQIAKEAQEQPVREMHGQVATKGFEAILTSKDLTEDQKKKLLDLHKKMTQETFKIQDETSQLKGVLFEAITKKPYDSAKVKVLKKKLLSLNDQKMKNMMKALDQVQTIVGEKQSSDTQDFYRPFFWEQAHEHEMR